MSEDRPRAVLKENSNEGRFEVGDVPAQPSQGVLESRASRSSVVMRLGPGGKLASRYRSARVTIAAVSGDREAPLTPRWRRVFITGSPGAGKTVLARGLSHQFGMPAHEMDLAPMGLNARGFDGDWIVEGSQVWQLERYLERAEVIIWLDLPMRYTLGRILRRHIALSMRRRNPHGDLRLLVRFLLAQPRFFTAPPHPPTGPTDWAAITRANHEEVLAPYFARVVHLRSPRETRRWFRSI